MSHNANIVFTGHVDHGKSTIIGRLLADTHVLPEEKVTQVKTFCEKNARPFEYAFLIDALKDERAQGITIDSARVFFKSQKRDYIIIDAPGHREFLKNMITGTARADAAVIVIDAVEGMQENTRRHAYLLPFLGVDQVIVLVNKMDLVEFRRDVFDGLVGEFRAFCSQIGVDVLWFIPVSGLTGENLVEKSASSPWYDGPSFLEAVDGLKIEKAPASSTFRMPVQDVYKFTKDGDNRRILAGTIESGELKVGMELVFYPSGKHSKVKSIESLTGPQDSAQAGEATGFTLIDQLYLQRGEIAAEKTGGSCPVITTRAKTKLFWLGKKPLAVGSEFILKLGTSRVEGVVEALEEVIDASTLERSQRDTILAGEFGLAILKLKRPIAYDPEQMGLRRFVLIDDYQIKGGGVIEASVEENAERFLPVFARNQKWIVGSVGLEDRIERQGHRPCLVLVTGAESRKEVGAALEKALFHENKNTYFLGMGSLIHGLDADLPNQPENRQEHLRRLSELTHILLDAGMILIVSTRSITPEDRQLFSAANPGQTFLTVFLGNSWDPGYDLIWNGDRETAVPEIISLLKRREILPA